MKLKILILLSALILFSAGCAAQSPAPIKPSSLNLNLPNAMQLTSSAFPHNGSIPSKYTCDGDNTSPPLQISDVPEGAKSLVLVMDDPDAMKPAGKVWNHWIVFNIPMSTIEIAEGQEPQGVHGKGTSNNLIYHGPCPPDAEHRYFFKLYALDTTLDLTEGAAKLEVEGAMEGHILDQAELIGLYNRQ